MEKKLSKFEYKQQLETIAEILEKAMDKQIEFSQEQIQQYKIGYIPIGVKKFEFDTKDIELPLLFIVSEDNFKKTLSKIDFKTFSAHFKLLASTSPVIRFKFNREHKYYVRKNPEKKDVLFYIEQQIEDNDKKVLQNMETIQFMLSQNSEITTKSFQEEVAELTEQNKELQKLKQEVLQMEEEELHARFTISNYHKNFHYDQITTLSKTKKSKHEHIAITKCNILVLANDFFEAEVARTDKVVEQYLNGHKRRIDMLYYN